MSARRPSWIALGLLGSAACLGCGGPTEPAPRDVTWFGGRAPEGGAPLISSNLPIERFFPLIDGYIYSYVTRSDSDDEGALTAIVGRRGPHHGELRLAGGTRRFEYTAQGIVNSESGAFVLKAPLTVGATWRGEHRGVATITEVDLFFSVAAGSFSGCVRVVEERLGDRPTRYETVFCPDVGVVVLEVTNGVALDRAELKSYGPPVKLGPDGLDFRTQP